MWLTFTWLDPSKICQKKRRERQSLFMLRMNNEITMSHKKFNKIQRADFRSLLEHVWHSPFFHPFNILYLCCFFPRGGQGVFLHESCISCHSVPWSITLQHVIITYQCTLNWKFSALCIVWLSQATNWKHFHYYE